MDNSLPGQIKPRPKMPRHPGDLSGLQRRLWYGIAHCEHILRTTDRDELIVRTVHALTQASAAYAKLVELGELQQRVEALEAVIGRDGDVR